jgi:outer membrane protein OmpA-like peptidoglycan-associated protein
MSPLLIVSSLIIVLPGCQRAPSQVAALPTIPPPPVLVIAPPHAERRILLSIQFGFDDYSIRPDSFATLDNLAAALKDERLRGTAYEINGHTDLRGNFSHNIALSALRAKAVSDYLRNSGVQIPPIRAQGFGPLQLLYVDRPFSPENRRVEVIATGP